MIGATNMQFGDFDFQTTEVAAAVTDIFSSASTSIQADKLAEADGAVIVKSTLEPKTFKVEGTLASDTVEDTHRLIDRFKLAMSEKNQAFDIEYAGDTRRYVSMARNTIISYGGRLDAGFSVEFLCAAGVGSDTYASTLLASTNVSTTTAILGITVGGTYKAQPVITVTINTVTGATDKTLLINNAVTLRGISVTRTWTAGDVMVIDSMNQAIFINNAAVEFSGQFPEWEVGAGSIGVVNDFTTCDISVEADYTRRYL